MSNVKRISAILFVAWTVALVAYGVFSTNRQYDEIAQRVEAQARIMHQRLSQQVDQHDVHLSAISSLLNAATPPPIDLLMQMITNLQRFYKRIAAVDIVALGVVGNEGWVLSTRAGASQTTELASTIRAAANSSAGTLILHADNRRSGEYLLIKRSPNSDAARYGVALGINLDKLVPDETTMEPGTALTLALPDGTVIYSFGATTTSIQFPWHPDTVIWEKQLSSASQPLRLRIERQLTYRDLLSLKDLILAALLLGVVAALVFVFARQVSEIRRAETRARLGEHEARIAQASRINALGEMASGIAHELNQPLTALLSQSQAGMRILDQDGTNEPAIRQVLETNVRQAKRAGQILSRLRNWIKPAHNSVTTANLNIIARDIADLLADEHNRRGITLSLALIDEVPLVNGDPVQIEQIVFNFVRNAADGIDDAEGTRRDITLQTQRKGEMWEIIVLDSGAGIPANVLPHLFEPFHTTKPDGMGLGLALCENITRRLGGRIDVTNAPGGGVRAAVAFPVAGKENG